MTTTNPLLSSLDRLDLERIITDKLSNRQIGQSAYSTPHTSAREDAEEILDAVLNRVRARLHSQAPA